MEPLDDFFGEQQGEEAIRMERERDIAKLQRIHVATGFRDAAEISRDVHLQKGFDAGFMDGAKAVAPAAYWMGVAAVFEARATRDGLTSQSLRRLRMELRNEIRALEVDGTISWTDSPEGICRESGFNVRPTFLQDESKVTEYCEHSTTGKS